jgi:hypothetical protein
VNILALIIPEEDLR